MRQKTLVVPRRKIRALVRPARLPPAQSGVHDRLGHVEHEGQFQGSNPFRVECPAVILDGNVGDALLKGAQPLRSRGQ